MPSEVELELKMTLPDHAAWEWVRSRLGPGIVAWQTNHFFDDPDRRFRDAQIGIRIREENSGVTLTLKSRGQSGGSPEIARRIELETPIGRERLDAALRNGLELSEWLTQRRLALDWGSPLAEEIETFLDEVERLGADGTLFEFGRFRNRREDLQLELEDEGGPLRALLHLDQTTFPNGRIDYEIEVEESSEEGGPSIRLVRAIKNWLSLGAGIQVASADSKLARLERILRPA